MSNSQQEDRLAADHPRTVRPHGITDAQAAAQAFCVKRGMTFAEHRDADGMDSR